MCKFHPLEVGGRRNETQLQEGENLNYEGLIIEYFFPEIRRSHC